VFAVPAAAQPCRACQPGQRVAGHVAASDHSPGLLETMFLRKQSFGNLVQLRNFAVPASLEGVSLGTVLLATTGNALMVPRALITEDAVWFSGSAWGSLFGWAQLLSLYLARTPAGCVPSLEYTVIHNDQCVVCRQRLGQPPRLGAATEPLPRAYARWVRPI